MPSIQAQRSLFEAADVEVTRPEPKTRVQVGTRVAEIPLARKRKTALLQLMPILKDLEGKDVYIGSYWNSHNHFWANNLKLGRLQVDTHGQSPWHLVTQASLDALRAITHSPTGFCPWNTALRVYWRYTRAGMTCPP